ncbi:Multiple organellar RNA editing factor 8, chloroplastic/mitochondrial [Dichanthelium oligosanthes]|uniref:Multiple organellar RNA editing factor 8, chloroplastic/mitochondrial n=1 Tax=Dichanthelium oligosanthes TaxID=888268 RepID=A0A1E5WKK2_9POAL|nr:Multiple organellar RNA editing factor 8, chloroplastic/mitochondrial [Dichanthelium oligosanthes]
MRSASRALRLARLSAPLRGGGGAVSSRPLSPLAAAAGSLLPLAQRPSPSVLARLFATQAATSSLRDSSPNWSNRPPKETILLDGCDFEHWLVVMEPPPGDPGNPDVTRDEIIGTYIETLAKVVGSEEEARQKIYSVSTRHYFAFGALVSEELSYKIKELPNVRWVLPDSYLDVKNKDYGGEPFINGQAVPYDLKYHEEWVRNNERANIKNRRNDRPRNIERRRENFQNRDVPPGPKFNSPPPGQNPMPPRDAPPMHRAQRNMPPPPPPNASASPSYQPHAPNYQQGGAPGYQGGMPGYQGSPGGNMHGGPGPAYQSNNHGYQGGGPGYQGSNPPPPSQGGGQTPYQGSNPQPPFQGGGQPPYQGGNPSYGSGGAPGYPGQAGNANYQQGSSSYNGGAPGYGGKDGPGRNIQ